MIRKIKNKILLSKKGNLIKYSNRNELKFKFGEIYFSEVLPNKFKGWKFHENRNQLVTVVTGKICFIFKQKNKKLKKIIIGSENQSFSIFIPKKTNYSFRCISKKKAIIANIIDEIVN